MQSENLLQWASALLLAVKKNEPTQPTETRLAHWRGDLAEALPNDEQKKAFWINIYNAWFQMLATRDQIGKPDIYREPLVKIAGHRFSLDDIEHGILRKYRYKLMLGFLPNPFAKATIRKLAVKKIDFRIHFALNCGAVSCPPIAFYDAEKIDQQLELATLAFLESETEVSAAKKEIQVSRLLFWYLGDFGGYRGIKKMLRKYLSVETSGKRIVFRAYDWTERLGDFSE